MLLRNIRAAPPPPVPAKGSAYQSPRGLNRPEADGRSFAAQAIPSIAREGFIVRIKTEIKLMKFTKYVQFCIEVQNTTYPKMKVNTRETDPRTSSKACQTC